MHKFRYFLAAVLGIAFSFQCFAIERVYLKSGSTLIATEHKDKGRFVEIALLSGGRVSIDPGDIDKITVETSAPIDLSKLGVNPEELIPEWEDPLNEMWLDIPEPTDLQSARLYLSFAEQLERGIEIPLAKSVADVKDARLKKVPVLEFVDRLFYLGMDLQYHDEVGMDLEESFMRLQELEIMRDVEKVADFITRLRHSQYEPQKEAILAAAIDLRDRLDPNYNQQLIAQEGWSPESTNTGGNLITRQ